MSNAVFEENLSIIEREIQKRKYRWTLDAIAWLDWDDVCQYLRVHIATKIEKWKPEKGPLQNWLAAVIHNYMVNLARNLYSNYAPVCNRCAAFDGASNCSIYGEARTNCPLYCSWQRTKGNAYNVKLPLSIYHHEQEIQAIEHIDLDVDKAAESIHSQMRDLLKAFEYKIYVLLFVENFTEEQVVDMMPGIKNRIKGITKIKQLKKGFVEKARTLIYNSDVEMV